MKKIYFNIFLLTFFLPVCISAKSVTLRPDACEGKDAINGLIVPAVNYGSSEDFDVYAWTQGGSLNINRGFIAFNLSMIPDNAIITGATLYLYYNPTNSGGYVHSGNNAFTIYRINSSWIEDSINWTNQPSIDSSSFVYVPASTSGTQDYSIDVSNLVQSMVNDPVNSFGFAMGLVDENPFNVVMFASSDHPDSSLHPMLVVNYVDPYPAICHLHLQPGASSGKDAIDGSIVPNTNYGNNEDLDAYAWTQSGSLNINRGYLDFDLSNIDSTAHITNAVLSLFYNPTNSGGYVHSGNNAFSLYRIISPWNENVITWNNHPAIDSATIVNVAPSSSGTQDYTVDVTSLVQMMVSYPSQSFGFNMRLDDETPFNVVMFASSDHPDCYLHPMLDVTYDISNKIEEIQVRNNNITIYPNPVVNSFIVSLANLQYFDCTIRIFDLEGKCVDLINDAKGIQTQLEKGTLSPGMYFLEMRNERQLLGTTRMIIN